MFLWGRIPDSEGKRESFVDEILNKAHVFITPGFVFGSQGDRYVRFHYVPINPRLKEAKERILS